MSLIFFSPRDWLHLGHQVDDLILSNLAFQILLHLPHFQVKFVLLFVYISDKHNPPLSIAIYFAISILLFNLPEQ